MCVCVFDVSLWVCLCVGLGVCVCVGVYLCMVGVWLLVYRAHFTYMILNEDKVGD